MLRSKLFLFAMLALAAFGADAQHSAGAQPAAALPAEARQFDFLIGQWEVELTPKVNGLVAMIHGTPRLLGTWKAWPAFDGLGIDDELRVTDGSGNPVLLSHSMRIFDPQKQRWAISALDVYRARFSTAVAIGQGEEIFVGGSGSDGEGRPYRSRSRFHAINQDSFEMQQDRSFDAGASWEEAAVVVVARRVASAATR